MLLSELSTHVADTLRASAERGDDVVTHYVAARARRRDRDGRSHAA